jgi:hypothetical protein
MSDYSPIRAEIKTLKLAELHATQNGLKQRSDIEVERIKTSLAENEVAYPLFVAEIDGKYQIIDGHLRWAVMQEQYGENYAVDAVVFHGMSLQEAKKQCLVLSARYGNITSLREWLETEIPDINVNLDALNMSLPDIKEIAPIPIHDTDLCPYCGKKKK